MPYRTVNLKPSTYERLLEYKRAGRSFDDVVAALMDMMPEESFARMQRGRRREGQRLRRVDIPPRKAPACDAPADELGPI